MSRHIIFQCPRCGGDHEGLTVKEFDRPIVVRDQRFEVWATCPESGDPILIDTSDHEIAVGEHME